MIADALVFGEVFREIGDDATGERDIASFYPDTGRLGEGFDNRE